MSRWLLVYIVLLFTIGCTAQSAYQKPPEEIFTFKKFNAALNQKLSVETGDPVFVEGYFVEGEMIKIEQPIDIMIPGSMMIPFPVHIDPEYLMLSRISPSWKYFCAEHGKSAASFPGLGSVIREGDCVGIRISLDKSEQEWVVDNSNYNKGRGETIWSSGMSKEEIERYKPIPSKIPFHIRSLKRIVFNGFYSNQLHFSWEEIVGSNKETQEFIFDFTGQPTLIGIKGNHFRVYSADNIRLVYEWIKFH